MNGWLLASACIIVTTGLVHSILGERLIFMGLRRAGAFATGTDSLPARKVGILWATWHMATVLALAIAGVIGAIAVSIDVTQPRLIGPLIAAALLVSAALVLFGTRGRHPGWLALGLAGLTAGVGGLW